MIFDGYLDLGGIEIANTARTYAYAMRAGRRPSGYTVHADGTELLPWIVSGRRYNTPEVDRAPWVDFSRPESLDFAGLYVLNVDGFDAGNTTRGVVEAVGPGGSLARLRAGTRAIHVHGWLIGSSCCGVGYGLKWLAAALARTAYCQDDDTEGSDLTVLSCLPSPDQLGTPGGAAELTNPAAVLSLQQCAESYFRTVRGVGLVAGPTVLSRQGKGCGACAGAGLVEVEFTLAASNPWVYEPPVSILHRQPLDAESADRVGCNVSWVKQVAGVCPDPCAGPAACIDDPLCASPPLPPSPPSPDIGCACLPITSNRVERLVPAAPWFLGDVVLSVHAGAAALRNVFVRTYPDPGGDDSTALTPCESVAGIGVAYVPPNGTLVIDGTRRTATLLCAGYSQPGDAVIQGADGSPFGFVEVGCDDTLVVIDAPPNTGADAWVSLDVWPREPL